MNISELNVVFYASGSSGFYWEIFDPVGVSLTMSTQHYRTREECTISFELARQKVEDLAGPGDFNDRQSMKDFFSRNADVFSAGSKLRSKTDIIIFSRKFQVFVRDSVGSTSNKKNVLLSSEQETSINGNQSKFIVAESDVSEDSEVEAKRSIRVKGGGKGGDE